MFYSTKNLSAEDKKFFFEMLSYVSPDIEDVSEAVDGVEITCNGDSEESVKKAVERLDDMITKGAFANKKVKTVVIEDHSDKEMLNTENIFNELIEKGIVKEISTGVFAYSDIFLKVFRYFNNKIDENGRKLFSDITEYEFPVLYPVHDYKTGGYFESFPHHIMFQSLIKNDIDVIDRFASEGIQEDKIGQDMKNPVNVLRHAACVPVYSILSNSTLNTEKPVTYLVSGKCFRNEENNVCELARLNEFYMKEYVFIGTQEQCEKNIEKAKQLWEEWIDTFGLNCKIVTATDSFFASNYKKLKLFQILGNSKQEFQIRLPGDDRFCACGSANFHRTHFSKPYDIKEETGSYCYTACCAFGVDRLTYAFLSQKGIDPEKWDEKTRKEIFG